MRNVGQATAVSPVLAVLGIQNSWTLKTLHPKEDDQILTPWHFQLGERTPLQIQLTYSTVQGYKFVDEAVLLLCAPPRGGGEGHKVTYTFQERRFLGATDAPLLTLPKFST